MFPRPIFNTITETPRPTVTWNPADKSADVTLSGSNLIATKTGGGNAYGSVRATYGIPHTQSGYFEVEATSDNINDSPFVLVGIATSSLSLSNFVGSDVNSWGYYQDDGNKYTNNVSTAYFNVWTTGQVLGIAFKNGNVWYSKQGAYPPGTDPVTGTNPAFSGITGTIYPAVSLWRQTAPAHILTGRFKTADFSTPPPSGFRAWGS